MESVCVCSPFERIQRISCLLLWRDVTREHSKRQNSAGTSYGVEESRQDAGAKRIKMVELRWQNANVMSILSEKARNPETAAERKKVKVLFALLRSLSLCPHRRHRRLSTAIVRQRRWTEPKIELTHFVRIFMLILLFRFVSFACFCCVFYCHFLQAYLPVRHERQCARMMVVGWTV